MVWCFFCFVCALNPIGDSCVFVLPFEVAFREWSEDEKFRNFFISICSIALCNMNFDSSRKRELILLILIKCEMRIAIVLIQVSAILIRLIVMLQG